MYDLAVHLHKMAYLDAEERAVKEAWVRVLPSTLTTAWDADLVRYLIHERIKSVLVDAVRYSKLVTERETTPSKVRQLVRSLTVKLNAAGVIWGWPERIDDEAVARTLGADRH